MDLGAVAHLSTIKGSVPVLHFFDGFRTSHEIRRVAVWDYKDLAEMVDWDAIAKFRARALNPDHLVPAAPTRTPTSSSRPVRPATSTMTPSRTSSRAAWIRSTPRSAPTTSCSTTMALPMPRPSWWPWAPCATPPRRSSTT